MDFPSPQPASGRGSFKGNRRERLHYTRTVFGNAGASEVRGWKMMVKAPNGLVFTAKVLEVSDRHVVASGDYVLKYSMRCNLEIVRSSGHEKSVSTRDEVDAAVEEVVFAQGTIRIVYRVERFPEALRKVIEACGARRARPPTIRV